MAGATPPGCQFCGISGYSRGHIQRLYVRKEGGKGHDAIGWMCKATRHVRYELTDTELLDQQRWGQHRHAFLDQGPAPATDRYGQGSEHICHDVRTCVHRGYGTELAQWDTSLIRAADANAVAGRVKYLEDRDEKRLAI